MTYMQVSIHSIHMNKRKNWNVAEQKQNYSGFFLHFWSIYHVKQMEFLLTENTDVDYF